MKPVFGLIENRRSRPFEHFLGDLFSAMSGQAVEHYGMRRRSFEELRIYR